MTLITMTILLEYLNLTLAPLNQSLKASTPLFPTPTLGVTKIQVSRCCGEGRKNLVPLVTEYFTFCSSYFHHLLKLTEALSGI